MPREEMYLEDVTTAAAQRRGPAPRSTATCAPRRRRAGISARAGSTTTAICASTRTTSFVPVDLNCFLHALEAQIARLQRALRRRRAAAANSSSAHATRAAAIDRWLWDDAPARIVDYDCCAAGLRAPCAATAVALYRRHGQPARRRARIGAVPARAAARPRRHRHHRATRSGEQWDQPNGWAPLQWLAIQGLARYGQTALAREIRRRWLATVGTLYERESKLVEKYVVRRDAATARAAAVAANTRCRTASAGPTA